MKANKFVLTHSPDKKHWYVSYREACGLDKNRKKCYCLDLIFKVESCEGNLPDKELGETLVKLMNRDSGLRRKFATHFL